MMPNHHRLNKHQPRDYSGLWLSGLPSLRANQWSLREMLAQWHVWKACLLDQDFRTAIVFVASKGVKRNGEESTVDFIWCCEYWKDIKKKSKDSFRDYPNLLLKHIRQTDRRFGLSGLRLRLTSLVIKVGGEQAQRKSFAKPPHEAEPVSPKSTSTDSTSHAAQFEDQIKTKL